MKSKTLKAIISDFEGWLDAESYSLCMECLDAEEGQLLIPTANSLTDLFEEFIAESREGDCFKLSMESPVEEIPLTSEELEK